MMNNQEFKDNFANLWKKKFDGRDSREERDVGLKQGLLNICAGAFSGLVMASYGEAINPYLLIPAFGNMLTSGIKRLRKMGEYQEGKDLVIGALGGGTLNSILFAVPYAITYNFFRSLEQ